jgi:hypothetical protein
MYTKEGNRSLKARAAATIICVSNGAETFELYKRASVNMII